MDPVSQVLDRQAIQLVRLALANERKRVPLKRDVISKLGSLGSKFQPSQLLGSAGSGIPRFCHGVQASPGEAPIGFWVGAG